MTVIVTVNVDARYRGFLASAMLEIAPGVYTAPRMTSGIRERVWDVLADWYYELGQGRNRDDLAGLGSRGRAANPNTGRGAEGDSGRGRRVPGEVQLERLDRRRTGLARNTVCWAVRYSLGLWDGREA